MSYHLVPAVEWPGLQPGGVYEARSLADEGFIHCTDGHARVIETANRYYRDDPRPYLVVSLDLDRLRSDWRYDDPDEVYPHVYGPVNLDAVMRVEDVRRAPDGRFLQDHEV